MCSSKKQVEANVFFCWQTSLIPFAGTAALHPEQNFEGEWTPWYCNMFQFL
jgi:hypothetical protein